MAASPPDPYAVLGVRADASDDELRSAYRELVKRHHPDHNGGSAESAVRFEQVQSAYAAIIERRRAAGSPVDDRLAAIEQEVRREAAARAAAAKRQADAARQQSAAAKQAATAADGERPHSTPEELGYVTTDDSFTKIIDDAADELAERLRKKFFS